MVMVRNWITNNNEIVLNRFVAPAVRTVGSCARLLAALM